MKPGQRLWKKDELMLAINLYSKLEFGKMHSRNPAIIELAKLINRTPGSVAFKLVNFASFDPILIQRGIKGASHAGELDRQVWYLFYNNWDQEFEKSELLLAKTKKQSIQELYHIDVSDIHEKGLEKKQLVKKRINQYRFRQMVLANYRGTCCITGLQQQGLLIASHITQWSKYENNRLNPANGLCLNTLHDRAFETGLITIAAEDFTIRVSSVLKNIKKDKAVQSYFLKYDGKKIQMPQKFMPSKDFLTIHNNQFRA